MSESYTKTIIDNVRNGLDEKFLFGHARFLDLLLIAYLSRGHVLIEGPPGTAKTLTAKLLAQTLSRSFNRIQFTTDLLPGDILGAHIFSPADQAFHFIKGPIFSDFIVADEINRTPPRTQSALLEAMEERQVTVEGESHALSPEFFVIATQNPQDYEGTFALPEVQLDRFLFKLVVSHAPAEVEARLLTRIIDGTLPPDLGAIETVELDRESIEREVRGVRIDESLIRYITGLLQATRQHPMLSFGSSVRGGIALARTSRVLALMRGRDYVVPDDIKWLAPEIFRHRVRLSPEAQISQVSEAQAIGECLENVEFPG